MFATFSTFVLGLTSGMPVAFALGLCGLVYLLTTGAFPSTLASQLFGSLNSSGLLAIPFFILSAEILSRSGAIDRLIRFVDTWLRHTRGGMPVIAVIATAIFAAICGSSVATAAAVGTVMIPEMIKRGYDRTFSVGLIASSGGLGILIPPSIPLVIYGMVTETSIGRLFAAGMAVGLGLTAVLIVVAYVYARRSGVSVEKPANARERIAAFKAATGVLVCPVIVLGGIYGGILTPTEAAAVSCVYAIALALFYGVKPSALLPMLTDSAAMTTIIMMVLAGAQLFGYVLTNERLPHMLVGVISNLDLDRNLFLLGIMLFYILCGMFLEVISIILITMPILMPILAGFAIDPIHFGILLILNMELAVITPPIGLNLFAISAISGMPVMQVFRGCIPFVLMLLAFLAVMTFTPGMDAFFRLF